ENTCIELEGPTGTFTICSLYRPPTRETLNLIPDLTKNFRNRNRCLIVRDFNARHRTWNPHNSGNTAGTALHKYARSYGYVISGPLNPTRIPPQRNQNPTTIDLGLSCGINNIVVESRYDLSSDHNPIHFVITHNFNNSHLLNCKTITNWNKYQNILSSTIAGNPPINNTDDIDNSINSLNQNIHMAINQASKFIVTKQDFTLVPFQTRIKIRGKNRLRKTLAAVPLPTTKNGVKPPPKSHKK
ncbi:putative RNA-directed DNA polymerase from transposon X-element, partial [Trichonephila clavata]